MHPPRLRVSALARGLTWLTAWVIIALGTLAAGVLWLIARGHYLEDYCFTRIDPPLGGAHGPVTPNPWTVQCTFRGDGVEQVVAVVDPALPLGTMVGAVTWAACVALVVVATRALPWMRTSSPRPDAHRVGRQASRYLGM